MLSCPRVRYPWNRTFVFYCVNRCHFFLLLKIVSSLSPSNDDTRSRWQYWKSTREFLFFFTPNVSDWTRSIKSKVLLSFLFWILTARWDERNYHFFFLFLGFFSITWQSFRNDDYHAVMKYLKFSIWWTKIYLRELLRGANFRGLKNKSNALIGTLSLFLSFFIGLLCCL